VRREGEAQPQSKDPYPLHTAGRSARCSRSNIQPVAAVLPYLGENLIKVTEDFHYSSSQVVSKTGFR
jgi:hypothetical protein